jgi:GxxExxY protein
LPRHSFSDGGSPGKKLIKLNVATFNFVCVRLCVSAAKYKFRISRRKTNIGGMGKMDINELTYQIRGAIFEVNSVLGHGFLEKVYEKALMVELKLRGLTAENQVSINVEYKGEDVGEYYADIIVENKVILELKAIDSLQKIDEAQMLNYLKATGYEIGLLVNFTYPKAEIKRYIL